MTEREALKLALKDANRNERHRTVAETKYWCDQYKLLATQAIEALAQPEQEPNYYGLTADHLWMSISKDHYNRLKPEYRMTCYTAPPQRKPLTDEQRDAIARQAAQNDWHDYKVIDAVEAAHGIKGEA